MESNPQLEKSGAADKKSSGRNEYVDRVAIFIAGSLTTYLAFKSDGYSFFKYVGVFAGIYLPIVGCYWVFARLAGRKSEGGK